MPRTIRKPDGSCCACEQDLGCDGCGAPCPGIKWRVRGGIASLIGWAELCSPSSPPRMYRRRSFAGGNPIKAYGTSDCTGPITGEAEPRQSGYDLVDRLTGALTSTAEFADGASGYEPGAPPSACGSSPGCESVQNLTRVSMSITGLDNCCNIGGTWRKATGTRSQTMLEEDLEEDARDRLLLSAPGAWGAWSEAALADGAFAWWQPRTGGAISFAYQEAEIRVATGSDAPPGSAQTALVQVWRAPWGSTWEEFTFFDTLQVGFFTTPSGLGREFIAQLLPDRGWIYWARGCAIREGLPE